MKSIEEMSKEEFKEHKKNADAQQKAIKLGYDRIKAKVKKLRSNFQKAVAEGTRSGGGRIIKDNFPRFLVPVSCSHFILSDRANVNLIEPV